MFDGIFGKNNIFIWFCEASLAAREAPDAVRVEALVLASFSLFSSIFLGPVLGGHTAP